MLSLVSQAICKEFPRALRRASQLGIQQNATGYLGAHCTRCTYCTNIPGSEDEPQQKPSEEETLSENDMMVNPNFVNRNPRNLEFMGIAKKRKGWILQYPTKEFYHRLLFGFSAANTWAWVEHSSGKVLITASTKEWAIKKHMNNSKNVAAAINIGRVIAHRCAMAGITGLHFQVQNPDGNTNRISTFVKENAFFNAVIDCGITGFEPMELVPDFFPGIDYDKIDERLVGAKPPNIRWRTSVHGKILEEAKLANNKIEKFLEEHKVLGYGKWHHSTEDPPHCKD
ncbi:39S ribosomal protein L18, mitochondrial [Lingula anatina]|uniref:Large ribosomal subunit protein uL18m n=1 Tax=Lingula anatina TaxID=7574 RepID=A0A1S3JC86_LINAN|nr:39S ribosomal protein L18, mitochondrial [Lingula anatina]|eukprot:XP_013408020.1 39S ribosomal protein L18, mitochondrial [Lingula anatina]